MNKEQQIEEMARVACEHFDCDMVGQPCTKCKTYDKHCYTIHQAEILYNAGYRKTFTSDFASDIQKAFKEGYEKGCENCAQSWSNGYNDGYDKGLETFAERCKEYARARKASGYDGIGENDIDELLKEYMK